MFAKMLSRSLAVAAFLFCGSLGSGCFQDSVGPVSSTVTSDRADTLDPIPGTPSGVEITALPLLSDLVVTAIEPLGSRQLRVIVKNTGRTYVTGLILVSVAGLNHCDPTLKLGSIYGSRSLSFPGLAPGATVAIEVERPFIGGDVVYPYYVAIVDPNGTIAESNESNNRICVSI